jgi:hypothetical protein
MCADNGSGHARNTNYQYYGRVCLRPGTIQFVNGTTTAAIDQIAGGSVPGLFYQAANVANHAHYFYTGITERARITAGGYLKASNDGTYLNASGLYHELRSTNNAPGVVITNTSAAFTDELFYGNVATAAGTGFKLLRLDSNSVEQFRVRGDGNVYNVTGTYGTISDAKLKQDVIDAPSQWDSLKAVRFRKYRFISDVKTKGEDAPYLLGVIAQELQATSPGLVDAHPDTERVEVEVEVEKSRVVMHEVEEVVTDAEGVESVVMKSVPMLDEDGKEITETYTETETRTETRQTGTETLSVKQHPADEGGGRVAGSDGPHRIPRSPPRLFGESVMPDLTLTLTAEEAVFIANVLGNLPTQSNAHPLWLKVVAQVQPHLQPAESVDGTP